MGVGNDFYRRSVGKEGSKLISTTALTEPSSGKEFYAVYVVSDTEFTTLTGNMSGALAGITFSAGSIIYGAFSEIQLASGVVVAYEDQVVRQLP